MSAGRSMKPVARIHSEFPSKFGVPRQSGLVPELQATVVFEPEFRNPDALRGMEGFSHLWLIWEFSQAVQDTWSPTVRPPRLGGNTRMGVFATRSPFRPNPIGLSAVKLEKIVLQTAVGPVLHVSGADLMDGTPIYDIKPYVPYADSFPEARSGFTAREDPLLHVEIPPELLARVPEARQTALLGVLAQDPRPRYQRDAGRIYGFSFAGMEIRFTVDGENLLVCGIEESAERPTEF